MADYLKQREEMALGFYHILKEAKKKRQRVSINAVGYKNLSGTVKNVQRYAVQLDRGDGVITTILLTAIRMVTVYEDNVRGDDNV